MFFGAFIFQWLKLKERQVYVQNEINGAKKKTQNLQQNQMKKKNVKLLHAHCDSKAQFRLIKRNKAGKKKKKEYKKNIAHTIYKVGTQARFTSTL